MVKANNWLLSLTCSFKKGALTENSRKAERSVRGEVAMDKAVDAVRAHADLPQTLLNSPTMQKVDTTDAVNVTGALLKPARVRTCSLPVSHHCVNRGCFQSFLKLGYSHANVAGLLLGAEGWNQKTHVVQMVVSLGQISSLTSLPSVLEFCKRGKAEPCGIIVTGKYEECRGRAEELLALLPESCQFPLLIIVDYTHNIAGEVLAHEVDTEKADKPLRRLKLSWTTQPKDQTKRLSYNICWDSELGRSHQSTAISKICDAILTQIQNNESSSGRTTATTWTGKYRKLQVPADGFCGWHSLIASEDLCKFLRVPRKESGYTKNGLMVHAEETAAKELCQSITDKALEVCDASFHQSIHRVAAEGQLHPLDLQWVAQAAGVGIRCTCCAQARSEGSTLSVASKAGGDVKWGNVSSSEAARLLKGEGHPAEKFGISKEPPPSLHVDHKDQASSMRQMFGMPTSPQQDTGPAAESALPSPGPHLEPENTSPAQSGISADSCMPPEVPPRQSEEAEALTETTATPREPTAETVEDTSGVPKPASHEAVAPMPQSAEAEGGQQSMQPGVPSAAVASDAAPVAKEPLPQEPAQGLGSVLQILAQQQVNPELAQLLQQASQLCGKPIAGVKREIGIEDEDKAKKRQSPNRRKKRKADQTARSETKSVKSEPQTVSSPEPAGIKALWNRFGEPQLKERRRRERQEAIAPLLKASRKPSQEDLDLPGKILSEPPARDEQSPEREENGGPDDEEVACILVRQGQWEQLVKHQCLIQTYQPQKVTHLNMILSLDQGSCSQLVGDGVLKECKTLTKMDLRSLKRDGVLDDISRWLSRMDEGCSVYQWKFESLQRSEPKMIRLTNPRYRNRHFMMPASQLASTITNSRPKSMSLYSTADFLIGLLTTADYKELKATAMHLDGRKLRVGSTCSGSEVGIIAIKSAHTVTDTQKYLLRQRRTRVWGCAPVSCGTQSVEEFKTAFVQTMKSLQSDCHFAMTDVFKQNQVRVELGKGRVKDLVEHCKKLYEAEAASSSLQDRCLQFLKDNDPLLAEMTEDVLDKKVNDMVHHFQTILRPVNMSKTDVALELLGLYSAQWESDLGRQRARRLCNACGLRPMFNQKPGAHLDWADPCLERLRTYIKTQSHLRGCHPQLVANFDQVWSLQYKPAKRVFQKKARVSQDPLSSSEYLRRIRHGVEQLLDWDFTEADPAQKQKKTEMKRPQLQGGHASKGMVEQWRSPRTVTTLSWIDGAVGRSYVTFRKGSISEQTRRWANDRLSRWLFVADPQPQTHIWSEQSLVHYLEFLGCEVRSRRAALGLTARHRAMVLMDQAGAHMSATFKTLKDKFSAKFNVVAVGWGSTQGLRQRLDQINMTVQANVQTSSIPYSMCLGMVIFICFGSFIAPGTKEGEHSFLWVLQKEDTRVPLPAWMSCVVEIRICKFISEHEKWDLIMGKRAAMNRPLTRSQAESHRAFMANCQQRLVFNKQKKSFLGDAQELKRFPKDCICITLHLSDMQDELQVEAGNGDRFQLLLLKKGSPEPEAALPHLLDHPAAPFMRNTGGDEDGDEEEEAEPIADMSEAQIREMDEMRHGHEMEVPDEPEEVLLLADSDEDLEEWGLTGHVSRVKAFHTRQAWVELDQKGLVDLPRHIRGCFISYHATSKQWQGHYPKSTVTMSSTWGEASKRTEAEAILRCVRGILQAHLHANPRDKMWERQLAKVQAAEAGHV
eukprot:Skav233396  [mRNA]  locus=scaffold1038:269473:284136:- [translate_table: standard]